MNWVFFTLLSAVSVSISKIFQKEIMKDAESDTKAFGFLFQVSLGVLFFLYTYLLGTYEFPNLWPVLMNVGIMVLFYNLANISMFEAYKRADASEVTILASSNTLWSILIALVVFSEKLTITNVFGIFLLVIGVMITSFKKTDWKLNKGHLFALLAAMFLGVAFSNDVFLIQRFSDISSYLMLAFFLPGMFTLVYSPRLVGKIAPFFKKKTIAKFIFCILSYGVAAISVFTAIKVGGKSSLVSPLQQTNILFTLFLSYLFLNERNNLKQKVIGAVLSFIGLFFLVQ